MSLPAGTSLRVLAAGTQLAALLFAAGCGDDGPMGGATLSGGGENGEIADLAGGPCQVEVALPPLEGASHVPACTPVTYASKPPSSGPHYGSWPVFRIYDQPVPWGFLMHGLEHGAVVIAHNCSGDCSRDLEQVRALHAAVPSRPQCPRPPVIVTPDPTLDVPFAASAWGATLRARCFDRERFAAFVERRRDRGPELFPNDCGISDLEAARWCSAAMP
jgi:hypothetical protein